MHMSMGIRVAGGAKTWEGGCRHDLLCVALAAHAPSSVHLWQYQRVQEARPRQAQQSASAESVDSNLPDWASYALWPVRGIRIAYTGLHGIRSGQRSPCEEGRHPLLGMKYPNLHNDQAAGAGALTPVIRPALGRGSA
jgi:hypothetical protein